MKTNKFNGTNYNDWLRNLRIILDFKNQGYVLDKPLPTALPEGSSPEERVMFNKWHEDNHKVRNIILASMTNEIQKQYDRLEDVPSIMLRMKDVYAIPDRHIRYAATKVFFRIKMAKGSSVQSHGITMLSLVEKLEDLKIGLDNDTYIDVILQSLPPSYDPFIFNYNMNGLEKSIHELINMLVQYEQRPASPGRRYWERAKERSGVLSSRRQMMCAFIAMERGTGRGSVHNSSPPRVLQRSRKLSKDEMILRLGNGKVVAAEAVGSLSLVVSDHVRIELKDCYFMPSMVKNIISISMLDRDGYKFFINKNCFYLGHEDMYHNLGTLVNGLYILQQSNLIMTAQHKRKVDDNENAQIWHARLGHISKDRIRRFVDTKV
ncbi:UNVERIFIED_CONTAM: hypothetical protein Slati_2183800 [Sesamum latifolium]|uniref:Retrovirus-related Pol polyprotein from transposon TNT 1-94-like beta-barrel domain-containing protein n=1 Tax=Sesamum latifolium TaxID=2727402 RepID=A0AAW2WXC2_9LAMI